MSTTHYYDWLSRTHGASTQSGAYQYVFYDYYPGDELLLNNVVFKDSRYVTLDNTHVRMLNKTDIHMYDTSDIKIYDSGTLSLYTSAVTVSAGYTTTTVVYELVSLSGDTDSEIQTWMTTLTAPTAQPTGEYTNVISTTSVNTPEDLQYILSVYTSPTAVNLDPDFTLGTSLTSVSGITETREITAVNGYDNVSYYDTPTREFGRVFTVNSKGMVGIGLKHESPHSNESEQPVYDLDVRGSVGVNNYIHHNGDPGTFMLFGSVSSVSGVAVSGSHFQTLSGEPSMEPELDTSEINFAVSGVNMLQIIPGSGTVYGDFNVIGDIKLDTIDSLKQKIIELEARIAQLES